LEVFFERIDSQRQEVDPLGDGEGHILVISG
jgi:hypothetical protein